MSIRLLCNHNQSHVEYHYPMIKVEWLAAEILLILSSVGLVTVQICRRRFCAVVQPMGIKGQLHWPIRRRDLWQNTRCQHTQAECVSHLPQEIQNNFFLELDHLKNSKKTCHCTLPVAQIYLCMSIKFQSISWPSIFNRCCFIWARAPILELWYY